MKNILQTTKIITLAVILSLGLSYVYAWTAPTQTAPAGNVSAPLNTSGTDQTKLGSLSFASFLDSNNTDYFLNPNGDSVLSNVLVTGGDVCTGWDQVAHAWTASKKCLSTAGGSSGGSGVNEYGDGSSLDGDITSNTTLTANKQYNNLRIRSGVSLNTGGYIVKVKGTLTFDSATSKIILNGGGGGNGANASGSGGNTCGAPCGQFPAAGGLSGTPAPSAVLPLAIAGATGGLGGMGGEPSSESGSAGTSNAGSSEANGIGSGGVVGVAGAGSSSFGAATTATAPIQNILAMLFQLPVIDNTNPPTLAGGGSSGGSGGGGGGNGGYYWGYSGGRGGGAGGNGANGGNVWLALNAVSGDGVIEAKGGNGGNGGNGSDGTTNTYSGGSGGGGAGGSGGTGGVIVIVYNDLSAWTGSRTNVSGGTGGTGGRRGCDPPTSPSTCPRPFASSGNTGNTGKIYFIKR
ncbi:MAG: hypothetical protein PHS95_00865 [Candidatus Pacebacteria bacterium]|nr:hypothetical protein [Candidatus Paceibacterota bacterium]